MDAGGLLESDGHHFLYKSWLVVNKTAGFLVYNPHRDIADRAVRSVTLCVRFERKEVKKKQNGNMVKAKSIHTSEGLRFNVIIIQIERFFWTQKELGLQQSTYVIFPLTFDD